MIGCDIAYTYLIRDRGNVPGPGATRGRSGNFQRLIPVLTAALLVLVTGGCRAVLPDPVPADACALAFAPHSGRDAIDKEIIRFQETARNAPDQARALEQLGWAFVQKARVSYDQSFYNLAEQCAICSQSKRPGSAEALLLKGHALYNLHRFKDAEAIARRLSEMRAAPFDFGLLGDTLMEQGRLNEAVDAYQKMIDLKPGPQAYTRAAHIRWLKGDLQGAIEMIRKAAGALGPGDAESAAWAYTRLALYDLQDGSAKNAELACDAALQLRNGYAPDEHQEKSPQDCVCRQSVVLSIQHLIGPRSRIKRG